MDQKRLTSGASMYFPVEARCAALHSAAPRCAAAPWRSLSCAIAEGSAGEGLTGEEPHDTARRAAAKAGAWATAVASSSSSWGCLQVYGALLSLGDGHGAMGDGEIEGTGVEMSMNARLRLQPCSRCQAPPPSCWPTLPPPCMQA